MIDSKLPAGCEEAARRPPKSGVATATSTRRPRCTPNSTTFSRQLTCWSTTSSPSAEAPAGRRGSRTPSSSRWRSPKSSWDCRMTASFWRSPATGSRTSSPTCHVSRATTSVCARSPHRSSERSTTSPSARRGGAISCGCSIRPRSPARPRARRFGAPSSRGSQPTATAALTRATSGASPLSALRERRDPDHLRARPGKCSRARGRARDA